MTDTGTEKHQQKSPASGQPRGSPSNKANHSGFTHKKSHRATVFHAPEPLDCIICHHGQHRAYQCPEFRNMNVEGRQQTVRRCKLCLNCLTPGHTVKDCSSNQSCKDCSRRHHTMLHRSENGRERSSPSVSGPGPSSSLQSTPPSYT